MSCKVPGKIDHPDLLRRVCGGTNELNPHKNLSFLESTHSSILACRIPWTEGPGGLQSMRLQRVGHDWSDLACTHALMEISRHESASLLPHWFSTLFFSELHYSWEKSLWWVAGVGVAKKTLRVAILLVQTGSLCLCSRNSVLPVHWCREL